MKTTFGQLAAGILSLTLIAFLGVVFFVPAHGTDQQTIIVAIIPALSLCLNFLFGSTAGSQAKDKTAADLAAAMQSQTTKNS